MCEKIDEVAFLVTDQIKGIVDVFFRRSRDFSDLISTCHYEVFLGINPIFIAEPLSHIVPPC